MRYIIFSLIIISGIIINCVYAQKNNVCKNVTKVEDSLVLSLLLKYFPNDSISKNHLIIKGKIKEIKKYYSYLSFRLPLNPHDEIRIINFGTYIEHNPNFMLFLKLSDNNIEKSFVLGKSKVEDDLQVIQNLFSSFSNTIKENNKMEILEIFLQTRLGVLQTKSYIH